MNEVPSSEAKQAYFLCVVNKWARKWGWKDGMNEEEVPSSEEAKQLIFVCG